MRKSTRAFAAKIGRDLSLGWSRFALVSVVLAAGIFVLTVVAISASVLLREMSQNYEATKPASITLELGSDAISAPTEKTVERIRMVAGVQDAKVSQTLRLRVLDSTGHWQPLLIFVSQNIAATPFALVHPQTGDWPPKLGHLGWERTAPPTFGWQLGDTLQLRTEEGRQIATVLGSIVHDPAVAPAYQERTAYAYAEPATVAQWGLLNLNQIKILADPAFDTPELRVLGAALARQLADEGHTVESIQVPPAHKHPHQGILSTLLLILGIFGALTIVLSSLLASNAAASFLAREKRSIGILKTIGVPAGAIQLMVLAPLALTGILGALIGFPLGLVVAPVLTQTIATLLNFSLASGAAAWWAWMLPLFLGLLTPLALGLPISLRAQRLTILQALSDQETTQTRFVAAKKISTLGKRFPVLSMALRNAWRKKKRLLLSVVLMGTGGGLFLTSANLTLSWESSLSESFRSRHFDQQLSLGARPSDDDIGALEGLLPELSRWEIWTSAPAQSVSKDGLIINITYPDEGHGSFRAYGPPNDTSMVTFPLVNGTWNRNPGEVVLNQSAKARFLHAEIGSTIDLSFGGKIRKLVLVGVVKELGHAAAYLAPADLEGLSHHDERTELFVSLSTISDRASAQKLLTNWTQDRSLPLEVLTDSQEFQLGGSEHFQVLISLLLIMGLVTGGVGWLGVSTLLSLAVVERRREFGILRSLGATPGLIVGSLLAEAGVMLGVGFLAAVLMSLPFSASLGAFLGSVSSQTPLPLVLNIPMAGLWFALSLAGGLGASFVPARNASQQSIRETFNP